MKNKRTAFLAVSVFVNVITIIIVVLYSTRTIKDFFIITGTIGDTFGGISNPILGLTSIYLIYITYNNQRKANDASISTYIFNNIIEQIKYTRSELDKISYSIDGSLLIGIDAVNQFELSLFNYMPGINGMGDMFSEKRKIYQNTSLYDHKILISSINFLRSIVFITEKIDTEPLTTRDKNSALWYTKDLFKHYNYNYIKIINLIKNSVEYASDNKDDYGSTEETIQINYFIEQITIFDKFIDRLKEHNIISVMEDEDEAVTIDYYFTKQDIESGKLNNIKNYSIHVVE